jgi:hypothetical protein
MKLFLVVFAFIALDGFCMYYCKTSCDEKGGSYSFVQWTCYAKGTIL